MTTNAIDLNAPDIGTSIVGEVITYAPKPNRARKAPDDVRENNGRRQLVGYLGWKTILARLAARRP